MGSIKTDSINQYARRRYQVRITCRACGHEQTRDPVQLMVLLHQHRISLRVEEVVRHLSCSQCRAKDARIEPSMT